MYNIFANWIFNDSNSNSNGCLFKTIVNGKEYISYYRSLHSQEIYITNDKSIINIYNKIDIDYIKNSKFYGVNDLHYMSHELKNDNYLFINNWNYHKNIFYIENFAEILNNSLRNNEIKLRNNELSINCLNKYFKNTISANKMYIYFTDIYYEKYKNKDVKYVKNKLDIFINTNITV